MEIYIESIGYDIENIKMSNIFENIGIYFIFNPHKYNNKTTTAYINTLMSLMTDMLRKNKY